MKISIISASVRTGRNSHRVALFFKRFIEEQKLASVEILDLNVYQFPIFEERLKFQKNADAKTIEFAEKIKSSDGVIIVTPEYNGGYPASLKNVIDLLTDEWKRKPVAISTVSAGGFAGMNVITSLQYSLWKIQAWAVPAMFPVPKVSESYDEQGNPTDKVGTEKRAHTFLNELIWCATAKKKMEE
ncbi:NADPH-dependent FMN reductase [Aurantibacillus circumpalustris]|uniref:NADPH-dependent FMN reductase n=1 Tax=Aurantibacillus circumpalustris TaxID=3036359 RepID=UPI00295A9309|nr:NAD(P)H-dependent oxidoreductase [Aurantibacillus circumpalustris]